MKNLKSDRLNLGCGTDIREGWINLDVAALPGVDVRHDLQDLPLPFADECFSEILCKDILEHLEYIPLLKDLHRILKPGGVVEIIVPHFSSINSVIDPTHCKLFSASTFDFFTRNHPRNYYFDFAFQRIQSIRITFGKSPLNRILSCWVNASNMNRRKYERSLARFFPAGRIEVELVK
jgi:ubiquinone/menaquinone biosynthesis C-methylase UbiE